MGEIRLRTAQSKILEYHSGLMGISAVPGSGKTWTLSQLAAKLILTVDLAPDQEILVVTFTNSAADNFSARIGGFLHKAGLLEGLGYRVRTLHGLAKDIILERPDLAGLPNDFNIIDQAESESILSEQVDLYLRQHPEIIDQFVDESISEKKLDEIRKNDFPDLLKTISVAYIATAKDLRFTASELHDKLASASNPSPLLQMAQALFENYQAALNYRGAVDFNDLIRLAWVCLNSDATLVDKLHHRWPYILEDEAQDSSRLQEEILRKLTGNDGNWVRVGDPNQAIYESFTSADPNLLKKYISLPSVAARDLPQSGRSAPKILSLANALNDWVRNSHPNMWVRDALSLPHILPTQEDDPQPNPPDRADSVELINRQMSPEQELVFLCDAVSAWVHENPETTVAVLAQTNKRVSDIANALKNKKLKVIESLMNVPESTRLSAGAIANILKGLLEPLNTQQLAKVFEVIHRNERSDSDRWEKIKSYSAFISRIDNLEDFLYPQQGRDLLLQLEDEGYAPDDLADLSSFRLTIRNWYLATVLPTDQLVLAIAQGLDLDPFELATVHKLSVMLGNLQEAHPEWSREDLTGKLREIAKNERRFFNFSETEVGFEADQHPGEVVVATLHKSKGLEWDKVFLTSINAYDFPSGEDDDSYLPERWFIRDHRNLQAETLTQLRLLVRDFGNQPYIPGMERTLARNEVIRERLRLLYVGITRARKSLTITWNTGRRKNVKEALALRSLRSIWKEEFPDEPAI